MYHKKVNEQSPLRILEASIHGGLGRGNLGVILARAGVGKTACLVQIALDDLMRGRKVLHLCLDGQSIDHVRSWYGALFTDLAESMHLENPLGVRAAISQGRIIHAQPGAHIEPAELERILALYEDGAGFKPDAILVDGYDWGGPVAKVAATIGAFKAAARRLDSELWMTAQTRREDIAEHPAPQLTPPCDAYAELIDVALLLQPEGRHVGIRLLKDHDSTELVDVNLHLQCDTMRLVAPGREISMARLPSSAYELLSGAAKGAEAEFGACAEKYGVGECNYSFDGKPVARKRGLVLLSEAQLQRGAVSMAYLESHMHRTYPKTPLFQKVLRSIWHQVNTAGEVYVVGLINDDGTVKGGTGWAAELAKHLGKPVFVFDQEKNGWFTWTDEAWVDAGEPRVRSLRFTGTGTRNLSDGGKKAIRQLFARTFGKG